MMNLSSAANQTPVKTSFVQTVYRLIAQMSPARPFTYSVNPSLVAIEMGLTTKEATSILIQLASEGLLSVDQSMSRAYLTPKGIRFLQKLQ
jgi:hypothetical protein